MDGGVKRPQLWRNIQIFGSIIAKPLHIPFVLGDQAILIECMRYKSNKGWFGDTCEEKQRVLRHQKEFTKYLLRRNPFPILIPMVNDALPTLKDVLHFHKPVPDEVAQAIGHSYVGHTDDGHRITVIPISHLSQPLSRERRHTVAALVCRAIELGDKK